MPEYSTAIPGQLLRSSRPGYSGGPRVPVKKTAVDQWINRAKAAGIQSVICLLSEEHLSLYPEPGLLASYRAAGFAVGHFPTLDHQSPVLTDCQLATIAEIYRQLPKPVLMHCSAGMGRTGLAADHIMRQQALEKNRP
jgi:protein-tyrosine phosphatase